MPKMPELSAISRVNPMGMLALSVLFIVLAVGLLNSEPRTWAKNYHDPGASRTSWSFVPG